MIAEVEVVDKDIISRARLATRSESLTSPGSGTLQSGAGSRCKELLRPRVPRYCQVARFKIRSEKGFFGSLRLRAQRKMESKKMNSTCRKRVTELMGKTGEPTKNKSKSTGFGTTGY